MIKNFEKETCLLNAYERDELLPAIVDELAERVGYEKRITSTEIIVYKLKPKKLYATSARIRKIINFIRTTDSVRGLIATSKGYYVANTREEMEDYIESLKGREEAIHETRRSLKRQMDRMFPLRKKKAAKC